MNVPIVNYVGHQTVSGLLTWRRYQRKIVHNIYLKTDIFYSSFCSGGERIQYRTELSSKHSKDSCRFVANEQREGISGWNINKRNSISSAVRVGHEISH